MIRKEEKLIITFHTTTDAMAMERLCKQKGVRGRIIPVPVSITAGCGLAWCAPPDSEGELTGLIADRGLHIQGMHRCLV